MFRVTEYTQRDYAGDIPSAPARAITSFSSGSSAAASTLALQANTNLVVLQAQAADHYYLIVGTSTAVVAGTSVMQYLPSGGRETLRVPTGSRILSYST